MIFTSARLGIGLSTLLVVSLSLAAQQANAPGKLPPPMRKASIELLREGQDTFRYDTFGDEAFWGDELKLHEAIAGEANGGVGPGLSPKGALDLGLKVDSNRLSAEIKHQISSGQLDLNDPANTLALLQADAWSG